MQQLPEDIKLTYIIIIIVMMFFVVFIVFIILIYNKRQLVNEQQNKLKEAAHQTRLLQKELERQKALEEERERISHDMHDDLGAAISALKLQIEYLKQQTGGNNNLNEELGSLLNTSQYITQSMREILWSLDAASHNPGNFIQYITTVSETFFEKSGITVKIESKLNSDAFELGPVIKRHLLFCIKEALNNVYKHSNAHCARLVFGRADGFFYVDIIDDGGGILPGKHSGNGLRNFTARMKKCDGSFKILPASAGAHLRFCVPVSV